MTVVLIYYGIAWIALIATCYVKGARRYEVPAKAAASLGFVLTAVAAAVRSGHMSFFFRMLPAFACCFLGDVLLSVHSGMEEKAGQEKKEQDNRVFLGGVIAFLTGHIFFLTAFLTMEGPVWSDLIFPCVIAALTIALTHLKGMNMNGMRPHVTVYAFFVALLLSKAFGMYLRSGADTRTAYLLAGSFLFFASDFLLLFLVFYYKKPAWGDAANLVLYYGGLCLLALGVGQ